jgi:Leishmanolysin/Bacterial Ig-like domain (group 2)
MIAWPPCHSLRVLVLGMLLLAPAACGGDGRTDPVDIAEITLEPESVVLEEPGRSRQLTATALDTQGNPVDDPPLNWTSSDPEIVTVSATGLLRAQGFGNAEVTAAFGAVSATATVSVKRFSIVLTYLSPLTNSQLAAFEAARDRWESLIIGDLPDVNQNVPPNECGNNPATSGPFDDLLIFVTVKHIDNVGGTLGQAGPCFVRVPGDLTVIGRMEFDEDDLEIIENEGLLQATVLHEMGHVLGFGTLWRPEVFDLLRDSSVANAVPPLPDTHFIGPQAIAAFNASGGSSYTGAKVPVENDGEAGTVNAHWRESVFGNELMTGFVDAGSNPLSVISVRAMQDITYSVSVAGADAFTFNPALRVAGSQRGRWMVNDIIRDPIRRIDVNGNIVGVIHP